MEKSKVMKLILTIILGMVIAFTATQVLAADADDEEDFSPSNIILSNETLGNKTPSNNTPSNNTPSNNLVGNNSSSSYNNTNLPKTGIEDSMPVVVLVVVFGISAVYAYKKINDYKNV